MHRSVRNVLAMGALGLGAVFSGHAQTTSGAARATGAAVVDAKWRETFDAFAAADRQRTPAAGGVVFVGSSSIRLWNDLEKQFESVPVVKRGFGGSRLSDCVLYASRLITAYKPSLVIVYAGDNDIAEGARPEQVLQTFQQLVRRVHDDLPRTHIAYLSIKPSPLRAAMLPNVREANRLIREYAAREPNLGYIDVFSKMLDAQGRPRPELFLPDHLHLNAAGYAMWKGEISQHLKSVTSMVAAQSVSP
jgi:lysophospholipase L1-like esterase